MDSVYQEMVETEKYWTKDGFKEHVRKELDWSRLNWDDSTWDAYPISDDDWNGNWNPYSWIFWSKKHDDSDPLLRKIKLVLQKLFFFFFVDMEAILVQFWAATTTSDGRTLLTTQDQPFRLNRLSHGLCEYRMISEDYTFFVDGEEELGIPGRVYRNKFPEYTPNVEYYSVKEHPQRDLALRCGVRESLTFPVIERYSQSCVGVIEIVGDFRFGDNLGRHLYAAFQVQGLGFECFDSCKHHEMREKNGNKAHKKAFVKMKRVLRLLLKIYKLPLALTWAPCGTCKTLLPVEDLYNVGNFRDYNIEVFGRFRSFSMGTYGPPLRNGRGVVGRVLSFPNLLYCSDVTQFSLAEYPLAHFARRYRLRGCFAINLRNNYIGNDVYVLEILLRDSNKDEDPLTSLSNILETMKKEFKTFTLASGEVLVKELSVDIIEFQNGEQHHCVQALQVTGSLPSLEPLQNGGERIQVDSSDHQLNDAEQCVIDVNRPHELGTKKTAGGEHKNTGVSIEIPYEDIMKYSKLSRSNAAKNLRVSISTFKRVCRKYDINRWPPRNVDKVRPRQPSHVDHQDEVPQLNSNLPSNQASASIAHTQLHDTMMQNANTVNVKAKYVKGLMVLFPLSLSSTLEELYECIETRLPLSRATYHACYIDGDNDKITITFDQDLQFWLRHSPRLPGSNAVVLHIDPISQVYHMPVSYADCFPASLRPYIQRVKDVASDGNCGFRAIAGLMNIGEEDGWVQVRRDLLTELNLHVDDYKIMYGQQRIDELTHCLSWFDGCAEMDQWMTMPDMGHLIASRYNVVLYHLSHKQCLTFLPLRSLPIPAASRREITIGFVNNHHFVEVFLFPDHPVPPVARLWTQYRYRCAQGWDTAYNLRIQHFRKLVDSNVATTDVISVD